MPHEEDETKRYNFRSEEDEERDGLNQNYWRVYPIFVVWDETEECRVRVHFYQDRSSWVSSNGVGKIRPNMPEWGNREMILDVEKL
nr:hypothetical protein HmN_000433800 [Hymenolepis microstoma]